MESPCRCSGGYSAARTVSSSPTSARTSSVAAGAASIRMTSLLFIDTPIRLPATARGRGAPRREIVAHGFQRHCEPSEAIHSFFARRNGLLRCARNDGDSGGIALAYSAVPIVFPVQYHIDTESGNKRTMK